MVAPGAAQTHRRGATEEIVLLVSESTIDSEGFKGGTRGAPIMPRDAVSRTANVERTVRH